MFIDALQLFSDAQAVTVDAVGTNVIDLGDVTPKRDIANGEPMEVVFAVDVAAVAGDSTYELQVITSADDALGSPTVIVSRTVTAAMLGTGAVLRLPLPPGSIVQRYLGVNYNTGGTAPAVTVTAFLQPSSMASLAKPESYADAITIQ